VCVLVGLLLNAGVSRAQSALISEIGAQTAALSSGYQALGVNPANLALPAHDGSRFSLGLLEGGIAYPSKIRALGFSPTDMALWQNGGLALDIDARLLGFSFALPGNKLGIGLSTSSHIHFGAELNDFTIELLSGQYRLDELYEMALNELDQDLEDISLDPQLIVDILKGTHIQLKATQDIEAGIARQLFQSKKLRVIGGASMKYVMGMALYDVQFEQDRNLGFSSAASAFATDFQFFKMPAVDPTSKLKPVGKGLGFSVGATTLWNDRYRFSLSANDLGSIKWQGYKVRVNDLPDFDVDGSNLEELNIQKIEADLRKYIKKDILDYREGEERQESLPATLRAGASAKGLKVFDFWGEMIMPLNDAEENLDKATYAAGFSLDRLKIFQLTAGLVWHESASVRVPVGVGLSTGNKVKYTIGFSTHDVLGLTQKSTTKPFSAYTGLLHLSF